MVDGWSHIGDNKVDMVGQPTDSKDDDNHYHHFDNLLIKEYNSSKNIKT